jgi:hypothetical protein
LIGPKLLILAQTGKAAVNVKGMTIQSTFTMGINTNKFIPLNGESKANKIKELDPIEYICIDEISLVDKGMFG